MNSKLEYQLYFCEMVDGKRQSLGSYFFETPLPTFAVGDTVKLISIEPQCARKVIAIEHTIASQEEPDRMPGLYKLGSYTYTVVMDRIPNPSPINKA